MDNIQNRLNEIAKESNDDDIAVILRLLGNLPSGDPRIILIRHQVERFVYFPEGSEILEMMEIIDHAEEFPKNV